jgi:Mrp family chromosome partitioning ATPase
VNLNKLPAGGDLVNPIEAKLEEALNKVLVPGTMRSLVQMNLVRSMEVKEGKAKVTLASTAIPAGYHEWLKDKAAAAVSKLSGVEEVTVDFVQAKPKELNQIEKIIAVMSGKGGVGKSLVATLLATSFALEGKGLGIPDADITGPSTPISGVIDVFTPQELTEMIVKKAVKMAQKMNVRVLGVMENMSYLVLPEAAKKLEVFGRSKGEEMAKASAAPLLGRLPIDPESPRLCDEGEIERYSSDAVSELFANVVAALNGKSEG